MTLGASSALVESLQDPQQRDYILAKLQQDFPGLTEELAAKGEITEQEARKFVDSVMNQQGSSTSQGSGRSIPISGPSASPDIQTDLKALTHQLAELRQELEKDREAAS